MPQVLVIDDDPSLFLLARKSLANVADVATAETAVDGLTQLQTKVFDAVLLDIMLPDRSGLAVFCEIHEHDPRLPVIFMTNEATSETAIEAMQLGAFDYLAKPLEITPLRLLVSRAIEQRELSSVPVAIVADDPDQDRGGELFIGRSKPMLDVFKAIGRVSKQDVPILIRGESGTGKELVARAIYQHSHRSDAPFLAVNCAALPDTLLESELFGHERGAFTGADARRIGKFEQCTDGTLFLDEIGDMSPVVQAKVLRVLQEQRFERIGGNNELRTNARIVAATNRPLEEMVAAGDFRDDLLYRLNAVTIELPPLRDRLDDIDPLIRYFLGQAKREFAKPDLQGVSPSTAELMRHFNWPGNVRQLRAVVRRCVLDSVLPVLVPDILPLDIRRVGSAAIAATSDNSDDDRELRVITADDGNSRASPESDERPIPGFAEQADQEPTGRDLPILVDRLLDQQSTEVYGRAIAYAERYLVLRVLRSTGGNQSRAAEILGITRGKLRDRIATYDIRLGGGIKLGENDPY